MDKGIKVLLFGILAEKAGVNELFILYEKDSDTLLLNLKNTYPGLKELKFSVAVNKKIISENTLLNPLDEVALLPPFSGG